MLRVPVISAVGHERDATLIDDVAAVACSTPTHAAEAAVPTDCREARLSLTRCAASLERAGRGAVGVRARHLAVLARGPARALQRERGALNQPTREIRAAAERGVRERADSSAASRWSCSARGTAGDRGAHRAVAARPPRRRPRALGAGRPAPAAAGARAGRAPSAPTTRSGRSNAATPAPRARTVSR